MQAAFQGFAEFAGVLLREHAMGQVATYSGLCFRREFLEFARGGALEFNLPGHARPRRRLWWHFYRRATAPGGPRRGKCLQDRPYCLPRFVGGKTPCCAQLRAPDDPDGPPFQGSSEWWWA